MYEYNIHMHQNKYESRDGWKIEMTSGPISIATILKSLIHLESNNNIVVYDDGKYVLFTCNTPDYSLIKVGNSSLSFILHGCMELVTLDTPEHRKKLNLINIKTHTKTYVLNRLCLGNAPILDCAVDRDVVDVGDLLPDQQYVEAAIHVISTNITWMQLLTREFGSITPTAKQVERLVHTLMLFNTVPDEHNLILRECMPPLTLHDFWNGLRSRLLPNKDDKILDDSGVRILEKIESLLQDGGLIAGSSVLAPRLAEQWNADIDIYLPSRKWNLRRLAALFGDVREDRRHNYGTKKLPFKSLYVKAKSCLINFVLTPDPLKHFLEFTDFEFCKNYITKDGLVESPARRMCRCVLNKPTSDARIEKYVRRGFIITKG